MASFQVPIDQIQDARVVLSKHIESSPLLRNAWLSEELGCNVFLKLENMQPIGSFKIRGATYRISKLSEKERKAGVIAASAGNHAQGVAWGSKMLGVTALIVMPKNAPLVKVTNTRALGAEVVLEGDTYDECYLAAREIAKKTGRIFVHAFEDELVIAGQGTCGLEILDQLPSVDFIVGSIGGGGLMSGISAVMKALKPSVQLIGCQAAGAASMIESIKKGSAVKLDKVSTFADGIAVAQASEKMLGLLSSLSETIAVDDELIANAVLTLLEKAKVVSEGSGAIALAALEKTKLAVQGKNVVLIISGGNIDVNVLSRIIDRGLIRAGRRLRLNVWLSDRPGQLAKLTGLIAKHGCNVLQAIHDRSEPSTTIDQTEVALTLETRGPTHSEEVIQAIREQVLRLDIAH
jgi:threonine dehydratase